jgi:Spy/CpxP family protein refolding chaperone
MATVNWHPPVLALVCSATAAAAAAAANSAQNLAATDFSSVHKSYNLSHEQLKEHKGWSLSIGQL